MVKPLGDLLCLPSCKAPSALLVARVVDSQIRVLYAATLSPTAALFRKLLVFADSLTRWVEAVPFHSDPTSEQVLDAFMTHVVARHGCPRTLRMEMRC